MKSAALICYRHFVLRNASVSLFCGPTGSGKTEIWRVLAREFPQVYIFDSSSLTNEGRKGSNKLSAHFRNMDSTAISSPSLLIQEITVTTAVFWSLRNALKLATETDKTVFDKDCGSFIEMRTLRSGECDHLSVRFTWLNTFADGAVCGIQQSAKLPVHLVQHVLVTRQPVKYLYHEPAAQARIDASRAGKTIRQVIGDKHKRRALCKAMRSCFQWVDKTMNLFNDFGDSFYFTTESGFPSSGGLVLFENTYDGHKGLCYQVCT